MDENGDTLWELYFNGNKQTVVSGGTISTGLFDFDSCGTELWYLGLETLSSGLPYFNSNFKGEIDEVAITNSNLYPNSPSTITVPSSPHSLGNLISGGNFLKIPALSLSGYSKKELYLDFWIKLDIKTLRKNGFSTIFSYDTFEGMNLQSSQDHNNGFFLSFYGSEHPTRPRMFHLCLARDNSNDPAEGVFSYYRGNADVSDSEMISEFHHIAIFIDNTNSEFNLRYNYLMFLDGKPLALEESINSSGGDSLLFNSSSAGGFGGAVLNDAITIGRNQQFTPISDDTALDAGDFDGYLDEIRIVYGRLNPLAWEARFEPPVFVPPIYEHGQIRTSVDLYEKNSIGSEVKLLGMSGDIEDDKIIAWDGAAGTFASQDKGAFKSRPAPAKVANQAIIYTEEVFTRPEPVHLLLHFNGDSSSAPIDASPNSLVCSYSSGASLDTSVGNVPHSNLTEFSSCYFDGTTDTNNSESLGVVNVDYTQNVVLDGAFTIDFWIKFDGIYVHPDPTPNDTQFIIGRSASTTTKTFTVVMEDHGPQVLRVYGWLNGSYAMVAEVEDLHDHGLQDNKWHHIAIVRLPSNKIRLFFDGLEGEDGGYIYQEGSQEFDFSGNLIIGGSQGSGEWDKPFKGYIKEFRIVRGEAIWDTDFSFWMDKRPPGPYSETGAIAPQLFTINPTNLVNHAQSDHLFPDSSITKLSNIGISDLVDVDVTTRVPSIQNEVLLWNTSKYKWETGDPITLEGYDGVASFRDQITSPTLENFHSKLYSKISNATLGTGTITFNSTNSSDLEGDEFVIVTPFNTITIDVMTSSEGLHAGGNRLGHGTNTCAFVASGNPIDNAYMVKELLETHPDLTATHSFNSNSDTVTITMNRYANGTSITHNDNNSTGGDVTINYTDGTIGETNLFALNSLGTETQISAMGIDNLVDVDSSTTAPTNGQALVWDQSGSKWKPGTVSSSFDPDGAVVFNESGNDVDFRIEGDNDPNLLFVDGSADKIGIGTATPTEPLEVTGNIKSSGDITADGVVTGESFSQNDSEDSWIFNHVRNSTEKSANHNDGEISDKSIVWPIVVKDEAYSISSVDNQRYDGSGILFKVHTGRSPELAYPGAGIHVFRDTTAHNVSTAGLSFSVQTSTNNGPDESTFEKVLTLSSDKTANFEGNLKAASYGLNNSTNSWTFEHTRTTGESSSNDTDGENNTRSITWPLIVKDISYGTNSGDNRRYDGSGILFHTHTSHSVKSFPGASIHSFRDTDTHTESKSGLRFSVQTSTNSGPNDSTIEKALTLFSNKEARFEGPVGIGGTVPTGVNLYVKESSGAAKLRLEGSTHSLIEFYEDGGSTRNAWIGYGSDSTDLLSFEQENEADIIFRTGSSSVAKLKLKDAEDAVTMSGTCSIGTVDAPPTNVNLYVKESSGGGIIRLEGSDHCYIEFYEDGASTRNAYIGYANSSSNKLFINQSNANSIELRTNSTMRAEFEDNGRLTMGTGATCGTGGVWNDASSRDYKENIEPLSEQEAVAAVMALDPQTYNYKNDGEGHCGFIAEDVPDLLANDDRKTLSPMNIVAALTKVVQKQEEQINKLMEIINNK